MIDTILVELATLYDGNPHEKLRNVCSWGTDNKIRIACMPDSHIKAALTDAALAPVYKKIMSDELAYRAINHITI